MVIQSINLIVLRVANLEESKRFYELLGFSFHVEKHGNGPQHYCANLQDLIFELYPASVGYPIEKSTRLGFKVEATDIDDILKKEKIIYSSSPNGIIIIDPDGRKIELQLNNA